jgi:hypothetical protein
VRAEPSKDEGEEWIKEEMEGCQFSDERLVIEGSRGRRPGDNAFDTQPQPPRHAKRSFAPKCVTKCNLGNERAQKFRSRVRKRRSTAEEEEGNRGRSVDGRVALQNAGVSSGALVRLYVVRRSDNVSRRQMGAGSLRHRRCAESGVSVGSGCGEQTQLMTLSA